MGGSIRGKQPNRRGAGNLRALRLVRTCLERLPDNYRIVLMLRDIEDLDTAEVAARMHFAPNAVKVRLHRARQALKSLIERKLAGSKSGTAADRRTRRPDSPVSLADRSTDVN
jgi:DNA-directed RNA polymerase specialized sigma24 family protein